MNAMPHPTRNRANIIDPANAMFGAVASMPDAGSSSRIDGTNTSAKMNESTPSITQPSQQPKNPM